MPPAFPVTTRSVGYYHTGTFQDLYKDVNGGSSAASGLPAKNHSGNYGLYLHFDQMLYRQGGPGDDRGFTPFLVAVFAPKDINQFPFFIGGGLVYKGLIPCRQQDVTALGYAYGQWSGTLRDSQQDDRTFNQSGLDPQVYEAMYELTHRIQIAPWLFFQPSVQYIVNPGGEGVIYPMRGQ